MFSGERLKDSDPEVMPELTEFEAGSDFRYATLESLVRMKLTAFRLKDKVHLLDLRTVGLIDESWSAKLPPVLGQRLQELLESEND